MKNLNIIIALFLAISPTISIAEPSKEKIMTAGVSYAMCAAALTVLEEGNWEKDTHVLLNASGISFKSIYSYWPELKKDSLTADEVPLDIYKKSIKKLKKENRRKVLEWSNKAQCQTGLLQVAKLVNDTYG